MPYHAKSLPLRNDPVAKAIYLEHTHTKNANTKEYYANTKVQFRNENEFIENYEYWCIRGLRTLVQCSHEDKLKVTTQ